MNFDSNRSALGVFGFHTNEENLEYYEFENEGPGKSLHLIPKYVEMKFIVIEINVIILALRILKETWVCNIYLYFNRHFISLKKCEKPAIPKNLPK